MVGLLGCNAIRNRGRSIDSVTYELACWLREQVPAQSECRSSCYQHETPGLYTHFLLRRPHKGPSFYKKQYLSTLLVRTPENTSPPDFSPTSTLSSIYTAPLTHCLLLTWNSIQALFWFGFYPSYQMPSPYQRTASLSIPTALFQEELLSQNNFRVISQNRK